MLILWREHQRGQIEDNGKRPDGELGHNHPNTKEQTQGKIEQKACVSDRGAEHKEAPCQRDGHAACGEVIGQAEVKEIPNRKSQ